MGEIMTRMADGKQVALQKAERTICAHLNALAACLTATAGTQPSLKLIAGST